MRKVIGYWKAWPHFRNASTAKCNGGSSFSALEAEEGPIVLDYISHPRCSDSQSLRLSFLEKFANGNGQTFANSRFYHSSIQSLQCLLPSSVSVLRWVPPTSVNVDHAGPAFDPRASLLKVSRNFNLAAVSSFSEGGDHRDRSDGTVEGFASSKSPWFHEDRTVVFEKDNGPEERAGSSLQNGIGTVSRESFYSHIGSNTISSQTKPQPNWNERISQNTEAAQQWSLYLNKQRKFRPHSSGLKLFNNIMHSPLYTRCKSLVPGFVPRLICSQKCVNDPALILLLFSCTFDPIYAYTMEHISCLIG